MTYLVLYFKVMSERLNVPSDPTNSVDRAEEAPPISKIPPSTSQQRCSVLASTRLTEAAVKSPVSGLSFRQDFSNSKLPSPQSRPPQRVCPYLDSPPGRLDKEQVLALSRL